MNARKKADMRSIPQLGGPAGSERSTPHPVPLPLGEGTLVQGSLLPWGEGQDEGRFPPFKALPGATPARMRLRGIAPAILTGGHIG
jgi:hypothetical protein